jgi:hypothetical protein
MRAALALLVLFTTLGAQQGNTGTKGGSNTTQKKETRSSTPSFLTWLAEVCGLYANSGGLKGEKVEHQGDIWLEPITGGARSRLSFEGKYSWPIFSSDDKAIIALRAGDLWSLPINGNDPSKLIRAPAGTAALVATGSKGIVLLTDQQIGILAPGSGHFSPFRPTSKVDQDAIDGLRAPIRSYANGELTVREKNGRIEVEKKGSKPLEVAPQNALVAKPSVSHDGQWLVYVRSDNPTK